MSRSAPDRWPISSRAVGEVGDLDARADARGARARRRRRAGAPGRRWCRRAASRAAPSRRRRPGRRVRIASRSASTICVDVAALGRQQQRAAHGAEALHRHRDRDDQLAALVDAHDAGRAARRAPARPPDSRVPFAGAELAVERQVAAREPASQLRSRRARAAPASRRRAAAGRSAGRRRGHRGCGCRGSARRRGRRCARACGSARSGGAAAARRAPD